MTTKLKTVVISLVLLSLAAFIIWQRQEIKRLTVQAAALREQLAQATSLGEENQGLASQLKASVETSGAERNELMRLRSQVSKLRQIEQENAQLKLERQRAASQATQGHAADAVPAPQQTGTAPDVQTTSLPADAKDLGVVEFSDQIPTRLELGPGKECVVTPTLLPDGNLQLVFTSESKDAQGASSVLTQTATVAPGAQFAGFFAGTQVVLKPILKTK